MYYKLIRLYVLCDRFMIYVDVLYACENENVCVCLYLSDRVRIYGLNYRNNIIIGHI